MFYSGGSMLSINEENALLLIFKDDLSTVGNKGFPLTTSSETIEKHMQMINTRRRYLGKISETGQNIFQDELEFEIKPELTITSNDDELWPQLKEGTDQDSCVWGWWRKPWEYHPELFDVIKAYCSSGKKLKTYLFNQYMRRLYEAEIIDIYFGKYLTSVRLPFRWRQKCPKYYQDIDRLCGAFFQMRLFPEAIEAPSKITEQYYIDAESFELRPLDLDMIISPGNEIKEISKDIVDKQFSRSDLKVTDHTLLVLRKYRQKDFTKKMITERKDISDADLSKSFEETEWNDICSLLYELSPQSWIKLINYPQTVSTIGEKAIRANSRITRFDIDLFINALCSSSINDMLLDSSNKNKFSPLGEELKNWVISYDATSARQIASKFFEKAWAELSTLYGLSDLKDYFTKLPGLEMVSSAVNYEIDHKFYRDHLSHNIRAGLLATSLIKSSSEGEINYGRIAFFSGIFHDIAFPISTFPETIRKLANAIAKVQTKPKELHFQSIIETDFLHLSLHYVALLSCVPNLANSFEKGFRPWEKPNEATEPANKRLLQELLLCAKSEDHAIISAAILFNRAIEKRIVNDDIDNAIKSLLSEMTGSDGFTRGKEFALILQSIALHDRKETLHYHPVAVYPNDTPMQLDLREYYIPVLVSLADEFQDWGRPIGELEGIGIVDANVVFNESAVELKYTLNTKTATFTNVPYSLLYNIFSKERLIRSITYKEGSFNKNLKLNFEANHLDSFFIECINSQNVEFEFSSKVIKLNYTEEHKTINTDQNTCLVRILFDGIKQNSHDFIIMKYSNESMISVIKDDSENKLRLEKIIVDNEDITVHFINKRVYAGKIKYIKFGEVKKIVPISFLPESGASTLFEIELREIKTPDLEIAKYKSGIHKRPNPHLLDYDWRFTEKSAKWIAAAAHYYGKNSEICYLGCPTVALYDQNDSNWILLDKGHFALSRWIKQRYIDKKNWMEYNVFNEPKEELLERFGVIVTDPPWYDKLFDQFCFRIGQLIKPNGFLLITGYPPYPPYKEGKHEAFNTTLNRYFCNPKKFGSFEVDYEPPEFEHSWNGDREFLHAGLNVYRPIYMDLFRINEISRSIYNKKTSRKKRDKQYYLDYYLIDKEEISDGDYFKYRKDTCFPIKISIKRLQTIHIDESMTKDLVAWTTTNLIAKKDVTNGITVNSVEDILQIFRTYTSNRVD